MSWHEQRLAWSIQVGFKKADYERIQILAENEHRSLAWMMRILVFEALEARAASRPTTAEADGANSGPAA